LCQQAASEPLVALREFKGDDVGWPQLVVTTIIALRYVVDYIDDIFRRLESERLKISRVGGGRTQPIKFQQAVNGRESSANQSRQKRKIIS